MYTISLLKTIILVCGGTGVRYWSYV